MFLAVLGQLGWVIYTDHDGYVLASGMVSGIAVLVLMLWFAHTQRKWGGFLAAGERAKIYNPHI
jgi:hypothetical protein